MFFKLCIDVFDTNIHSPFSKFNRQQNEDVSKQNCVTKISIQRKNKEIHGRGLLVMNATYFIVLQIFI